jgi:hypothetical protein
MHTHARKKETPLRPAPWSRKKRQHHAQTCTHFTRMCARTHVHKTHPAARAWPSAARGGHWGTCPGRGTRGRRGRNPWACRAHKIVDTPLTKETTAAVAHRRSQQRAHAAERPYASCAKKKGRGGSSTEEKEHTTRLTKQGGGTGGQQGGRAPLAFSISSSPISYGTHSTVPLGSTVPPLYLESGSTTQDDWCALTHAGSEAGWESEE